MMKEDEVEDLLSGDKKARILFAKEELREWAEKIAGKCTSEACTVFMDKVKDKIEGAGKVDQGAAERTVERLVKRQDDLEKKIADKIDAAAKAQADAAAKAEAKVTEELTNVHTEMGKHRSIVEAQEARLSNAVRETQAQRAAIERKHQEAELKRKEADDKLQALEAEKKDMMHECPNCGYNKKKEPDLDTEEGECPHCKSTYSSHDRASHALKCSHCGTDINFKERKASSKTDKEKTDKEKK